MTAELVFVIEFETAVETRDSGGVLVDLVYMKPERILVLEFLVTGGAVHSLKPSLMHLSDMLF